LPEAVAKNYFIQIINGLQHCNELNIVHRDLKPENILVTTNNVVKISGIFKYSVND
jgi:serine/threonine protein kinase